jgi:hypothetical protein
MPYTLHIDAEGFPVMENGIRGDDPEFLEIVFKNLKRYQSDDKQPLCTDMNGKVVLLSSFDDPLVAREVSYQNGKLLWKFLGNLSFESDAEQLKVDEWNRLHAYLGPEAIPAVMSSKAQAAFLLSYTDLEKLKPLPYRSSVSPLGIERWNVQYVDNQMPWDMGKLNPVIEKHSQKLIELSGEKFLIPGAGSAHEAPFFEKVQKKVTALDFSPTAKEVFHKTYPQSKADYIVGDFFSYSGKVDAVLELAFFVAIDPALRKKAVEKIHSLLSPKAYWGGCFITRYAAGGPPFGLSEWELQQHIKDHFEIIEWQRSPHSHPRRNQMELWVLLKKR